MEDKTYYCYLDNQKLKTVYFTYLRSHPIRASLERLEERLSRNLQGNVPKRHETHNLTKT
jgi:hypothetical protein